MIDVEELRTLAHIGLLYSSMGKVTATDINAFIDKWLHDNRMLVDKAKCESVLNRYADFLAGIDPIPCASSTRKPHGVFEPHMAHMIGQMRGFLAEDELSTFMRWLGFLQGVLWAQGYFSLDELEDHNGPDNEHINDTIEKTKIEWATHV